MNQTSTSLRGVRVLTLALNLPGPAAVMRLTALGAQCTKFEPVSSSGGSGDPMAQYKPAAYEHMHRGMKVVRADLKTPTGQKQLHRLLARSDVLITSFRPSALNKLGLAAGSLKRQYPSLIQVAIVGALGERAEEPGHDLTYMAECGLVQGLHLPPSLFADMGGSLWVAETVLQALWKRQQPGRQQGRGSVHQVSLSDAAAYLGLPHQWGLTTPDGAVGGAHAGYQVYACKNGRVAVAALEPHFARSLCQVAGLPATQASWPMTHPAIHQHLKNWFAGLTRTQLNRLAQRLDIPLHTLE
ncbi:MAG: CaiB/BaiF CoA-transferase family protein [Alphaproteobacteria bacterium]|nr:CaiB/BaiF CoA-transferase family protein [Alphaproteobacteria bacterium]